MCRKVCEALVKSNEQLQDTDNHNFTCQIERALEIRNKICRNVTKLDEWRTEYIIVTQVQKEPVPHVQPGRKKKGLSENVCSRTDKILNPITNDLERIAASRNIY